MRDERQPDLFSGEAFDWRAFWPKPKPDLGSAPLTGLPCGFTVYLWKWGRRDAPKNNCIHAGRAYRVNHVPLSLCRFHAAQLARHAELDVVPDPDAITASADH
jgi:hypothetical protein